MKSAHLLMLLGLVTSSIGQPLDWLGDMTLFGSIQDEHHPCLSSVGENGLLAFCVIEPDTLAMKVSSDNGQSWSDASMLSGYSAQAGLVTASDLTYGYLIRYSTANATRHLYRFASSASGWDDAVESDIAPERQTDVACLATTSNAVSQPVDSYLSLCWVERTADGTLSTVFTQSRDQGETFIPAIVIDSSSAPEEMSVSASIAVTWNGEGERIHVAVPVDRVGSMPEELRLFSSEDQGTHWTVGLTIDSSGYAQRDPSLAAFQQTLFLAYCRRVDVTPQRDIFLTYSPDGGVNFAPPVAVADSMADECEPRVVIDPARQQFHLFYLVSPVFNDSASLVVRSGDLATPWSIGAAVPVSDPRSVARTGGVSVITSTSGVAAAWTSQFQLGDTDVRFDASWRTANVSDRPYPPQLSIAVGDAYPNPFNGATNVALVLNREQYVELILTDLLGRRLDTPFSGTLSPGRHSMAIDLTRFASGTYWLCTSQSSTVPLRLILLR